MKFNIVAPPANPNKPTEPVANVRLVVVDPGYMRPFLALELDGHQVPLIFGDGKAKTDLTAEIADVLKNLTGVVS